MTKAELIHAVWSVSNGISQSAVESVVEDTIAVIEQTVARGEKVTVNGFGTFESRDRGERRLLNPRTGEPMIVKAKKIPAFRAGRGFKAKVCKG